ncbi:MAG: endonuclease/exonuclease/phosphatase family protein [Acidobacteria bacterium]|nr:endonuclease/exonuclease/phosphatase family protein [Acidobacteriota bacterium]
MARPLAIAVLIGAALTSGVRGEPTTAATLKVLTLNTKLGGESPYNPSEQIAAIAAARPDVVLLQETVYLQLDQYRSGIARALGDDGWTGRYARHCKQGTARACETLGAESVMLLTRLPIVDTEARLLSGRDTAWTARGVVRAAVRLTDVTVLQIFATHLPAGTNRSRARMAWVADFTRWAATIPQPQIVGGDFNDVPAARPMATLRRHYVDAWHAIGGATVGTESSDDLTYTRRYDYLLSRGALEVQSATVLPLKISDHRPVVATYRLGVHEH